MFYSRAPGRQINQATVYMRFRGYLADSRHSTSPTGDAPAHSLGLRVRGRQPTALGRGRRGLAVVLPYLACYMGHADRGWYYPQGLTADAYRGDDLGPGRFGYVIPETRDEP